MMSTWRAQAMSRARLTEEERKAQIKEYHRKWQQEHKAERAAKRKAERRTGTGEYKNRKPAKEYLWMKVSDDEYQLPLAVANSATELARMVGTTPNALSSAIYRNRKGECKKTTYVKVEVTDD